MLMVVISGLAAQCAAAGNSALSLPSRINYISDNEDIDGQDSTSGARYAQYILPLLVFWT